MSSSSSRCRFRCYGLSPGQEPWIIATTTENDGITCSQGVTTLSFASVSYPNRSLLVETIRTIRSLTGVCLVAGCVDKMSSSSSHSGGVLLVYSLPDLLLLQEIQGVGCFVISSFDHVFKEHILLGTTFLPFSIHSTLTCISPLSLPVSAEACMQPGAKTVLQHLQQFVNRMNNNSSEDDFDENPENDSNDVDDDVEEESTQPHVFSTVVVSDREKISSTSMVVDDGIVGTTGGIGNDGAVVITTSTALPVEMPHRNEVILCCLDSPSVYRTGGGINRFMQGVTSRNMGDIEVIYGGVKAFTLTLTDIVGTTTAVPGVRTHINHPLEVSSSLITGPLSPAPTVITTPVGLPLTTSSVMNVEQMVQEMLRRFVEQQDGKNRGNKGLDHQTKKEKRRKKKEKKALAENAAGGGEGDVAVAVAAGGGSSSGGGGGGGDNVVPGVADDGGDDGEDENKIHKRLREVDDGTAMGDVTTTRRQTKKSKRTHHSTSDTELLSSTETRTKARATEVRQQSVLDALRRRLQGMHVSVAKAQTQLDQRMITVTALRGRLVQCLMQKGQSSVAGGITQPGEGRGRGVCGLVTLSDVVKTMRPLFPGNNNNNYSSSSSSSSASSSSSSSSASSSSSNSHLDGNRNKIGHGEVTSMPSAAVTAIDRGVVVLDTIYLPMRGFDTRSLTVPLLVLVRIVNRTFLPIFDVSVGVNHMHNEEDGHGPGLTPTSTNPPSHHHHYHHQDHHDQQQRQGRNVSHAKGRGHVSLTTRSGKGKMIPPLGEAWIAANVEVPLIAFLGPRVASGVSSGLGLGLGVGSVLGLQVLLAVRVFYRTLTTPMEHSHPIYLAKCQKLTQLLTADAPRACLEVSQGWMATSTQVLEAAVIPLSLDALTQGQSVTPASHWQGIHHQKPLGGEQSSLRGESRRDGGSLCGGGGGGGEGHSRGSLLGGGSLISGVYRHRARCLHGSTQLRVCLQQWCDDGVSGCSSSTQRTGTRASSSAVDSSATRASNSTSMFLSLCAPVQSLALLVRGRGIKTRARATASSSAGADGQGLAASGPGLICAPSPCPSSSFAPRSVVAALTEGVGSFVKLESLSFSQGGRSIEDMDDEGGNGEIMHVDRNDDRGGGREREGGDVSTAEGGQGSVSRLSSRPRATSILSPSLERAVEGFVRLLMVEEQRSQVEPGQGPGLGHRLGAVLAQLFFNDDGDYHHDHPTNTRNATVDSNTDPNGSHTNGRQGNTHTSTLTKYVHTSAAGSSQLLPALLVAPHPMGRAEGLGLGSGLGLGLGLGYGSDALALAMRLLSREVVAGPPVVVPMFTIDMAHSLRLAMVYLLEELSLLAVAWRQQNLRVNLGTHIPSTTSLALALAPARAVALAMEQKAGTATEQWIRFGPSLVVSLLMAQALLERQHRTDVAINQAMKACAHFFTHSD